MIATRPFQPCVQRNPASVGLAAEHGADGIVVSNHGGRNLDSAISPLDVLGRIVDACGDRLVVLSDSGIQRGSDLFKSLALGAKAVMIGRAFLFGTAINGRQGALHAFAILQDELDRTMSLSGCKTISDITAERFVNRPGTTRRALHDGGALLLGSDPVHLTTGAIARP